MTTQCHFHNVFLFFEKKYGKRTTENLPHVKIEMNSCSLIYFIILHNSRVRHFLFNDNQQQATRNLDGLAGTEYKGHWPYLVMKQSDWSEMMASVNVLNADWLTIFYLSDSDFLFLFTHNLGCWLECVKKKGKKKE